MASIKEKEKRIVEEIVLVSDVPETQAEQAVESQPIEDIGAKEKAPLEESDAELTEMEEKVESRKEEPCFVIKLQDEQVTEGEGVKLEVKAAGMPKPELTWLKDDKPVQFNERVRTYEEGDLAVLEITKTDLEDEADYICIARNEAGKAETSAELLVDGTFERIFIFIFYIKIELHHYHSLLQILLFTYNYFIHSVIHLCFCTICFPQILFYRN